QDHPAAADQRVRGGDGGGGGDPDGQPPARPGEHDARDFGEHHGGGGVEAGVGGAVGGGAEHPDRLGADDPDRGGGVGGGVLAAVAGPGGVTCGGLVALPGVVGRAESSRPDAGRWNVGPRRLDPTYTPTGVGNPGGVMGSPPLASPRRMLYPGSVPRSATLPTQGVSVKPLSLLTLAAAAALLGTRPAAAADPPRPNILFLFADDQRADTIAAW